MKKTLGVKSAIGAVAIATVLVTINIPKIQSATISAETGVAGVALSLDKIGGVAQNSINIRAMSFNINQEANLATNSAIEANSASENSQPEKTVPEVPELNLDETADTISEFANMGISKADYYVNIRNKPNEESKILGKLYRGCAATITETNGDWVKIKSGSVTGYIKAEYLAIGFSADELVEKYATKYATVNTTTLYLREEPNENCTILTYLGKGETFEVLKEHPKWVKVLVDGDTKGYVSREYINISHEFDHAISIEEEQEKLRKEEAARRAEEEAKEQLRLEEEQRRQQQSSSSSGSSSSGSSSSGSSSSGSSSSGSSSSGSSSSGSSSSGSSSSGSSSSGSSSSGSSSSGSSSSGSSSSGSSSSGSRSGSEIASYAQNFIGNRYVYGGTSLTNGTDCSGFVQSVYRTKAGVSLPRTSGEQANSGRAVSLDSVQPGDIISYAQNGRVNHVAIYIGNGQVVHASTPSSGIKTSNMYYRQPHNARRILN